MASGHLTHPSWDSDSKRGTTDGTMRNKYDQARAQDMPIIERVHGLAERLGVPMARIALAWHWAKDVTAPIVGCSKTERVDDVIEALGVNSANPTSPILRSRTRRMNWSAHWPGRASARWPAPLRRP